MDYLTDDTLSYLIETILDNNDCYDLSSFLVSRKTKSVIDIVVNNKLKLNYKIVIRNNTLLNPLQSYANIYKIYGNKFCIDKVKLENLICLIIINNNKELTEIISKTLPGSVRSSKAKLYDDYRMDDVFLWDSYIKLSNKRNVRIRYVLKNTDYDFIIFKNLLKDFCEL